MHNAIAYSKRYELYSPILLLDWGERIKSQGYGLKY